MLGHLAVALSAAVATDRQLVLDDAAPDSPWPFSAACLRPARRKRTAGGGRGTPPESAAAGWGGLGCGGEGFFRAYLAPPSAADAAADERGGGGTWAGRAFPPLGSPSGSPPGSRPASEAEVVVVEDDSDLPSYRLYVPAALRARFPADEEGAAVLWWFAAVMEHVTRPQRRLWELAASSAGRIGLPARYVGMHVRRGHKWVETSPRPLQEYLDAAFEVAEAAGGGVRDVLVSTEDPEVVDGLRAMVAAASTEFATRANRTHVSTGRGGAQPVAAAAAELARGQRRENWASLRLHFTDNRREGLRISIPQALRLGLLSAEEENEVSLVNLLLQADACGFVGTFSSGYSKRIFELQVARQERIPPFVSLDLPWAP